VSAAHVAISKILCTKDRIPHGRRRASSGFGRSQEPGQREMRWRARLGHLQKIDIPHQFHYLDL